MKSQLNEIFKKYSTHPEFLGDRIVDPNQRGAVDDTMLHIASRMGALEDIQSLIAAGANVNMPGDLGNTPLHQAAMMGQVDSVKLLLKLGARRDLKNEFDQTSAEVTKLSRCRGRSRARESIGQEYERMLRELAKVVAERDISKKELGYFAVDLERSMPSSSKYRTI